MLIHNLAFTIINITVHLHLVCTTFENYPHLLNHGWNTLLFVSRSIIVFATEAFHSVTKTNYVIVLGLKTEAVAALLSQACHSVCISVKALLT